MEKSLDDVEIVCCENLQQRITQIKDVIESAENCLVDRDYHQCAVRIQMIAKYAEFDDLYLRILDLLSVD